MYTFTSSAIPQVARGSRLRQGRPGTKWSEEERCEYERDCVELLKRKHDETAAEAPKSKQMKRQVILDGLATFDYGMLLDDTVNLVTGRPLTQFHNPGPLPLDRMPRTLVICADFLQTQWRCGWYLRHKCELNLELILETTHRRHNDITLATSEAGYSGVHQRALIVENAHYGPWSGGAHHKDIQECALDLSENAPTNDPILLHFWPTIILDLKLEPELHGAEGRKWFLEHLLAMDFVRVRSGKSAKSRWASVSKYWMDCHDSYPGALAYVLTHFGKRKRWIKCLDDLQPPSSSVDVVQMEIPLVAAPAPKAKAKGKAAAAAKMAACSAKNGRGGRQGDKAGAQEGREHSSLCFDERGQH